MCGIVGFVGHVGTWDPRRLIQMRDALAHRGPDGAGARLFDEQGGEWNGNGPVVAGLGHRRLSIIDLTEAGAQPMSNEDGSIWITYNGEFYNFEDYRKELESRGHCFRSRCDTETIIHLYEEYGIEETLRRINGMFAFALWDTRAKTLHLARDRFGKKPLYYAIHEGMLIFASEIKALLASGLIDRSRIDRHALIEALHYGTPFRERTIFEQIRALPAGHRAIWRQGSLQIREYYRHPYMEQDPVDRPIHRWVDELESILTDAVRRRLVADVPVGLFLSGGTDSSLIAAIVSRVLKHPLQAYTVSFAETAYDESYYARRVAEHLRLPLKVLLSQSSNAQLDEHIARHIDQPLGDSSVIPTYMISRAARESGAVVVLTGDGGDEVFGGYESYRQALKLWGDGYQRQRIRSKRTPFERLWEQRLRIRGFAKGYLSMQQQFSRKHLRRLCRPDLRVSDLVDAVERDRLAILDEMKSRGIVDRCQYSDMRTMLVDDILRKVDMASMACGLECRSPFLDYRVVEFSARLPLDLKIDAGGRGKSLLRALLARYLPLELIERPKMGFCMPWAERYSGELVRPLVDRWRKTSQLFFRPEAGAWIFNETGTGALFRKWNAFCHLIFFEQHAD